MMSSFLLGFLDLDEEACRGFPSALYLASRSFRLRLRSRSSRLNNLLAIEESEFRLVGRLDLSDSGGSANMSSACVWARATPP